MANEAAKLRKMNDSRAEILELFQKPSESVLQTNPSLPTRKHTENL